MNWWTALITGLTTGAISCMALQGGLLAGLMAGQKQDKELGKIEPGISKDDWLPVAMFLAGKLAVHAVLGLLLGWLGSVLIISLAWRMVFQMVAIFFMGAMAMNLLEVHPIFRLAVLQPPKWAQRLVRGTTKSKLVTAPLFLGVATVLIPCGVTQAMEVAAVNSGDPFKAAGIMAGFVVGTMPVFAILGLTAAKLSENWRGRLNKIAAGLLIAMALYSLNGVLTVAGVSAGWGRGGKAISLQTTDYGLQQVKIEIEKRGYNPRYIKVKKGVPVELTLESKNVYSCALAFVMREFGINTIMGATDKQVFKFTPQKTGRFPFSCSMGMFTGMIEVI